MFIDHNEKVDGTVSLKAGQNIQVKVGQNYALDAETEIHLKAGMNVVIESGTSLTLKVGGNFVNINSGGVFIKGSMVMINSGGAAGSGAPCNPTPPTDAKEADTANPGEAVTAAGLGFEHPVDIGGAWQAVLCSDCHHGTLVE